MCLSAGGATGRYMGRGVSAAWFYQRPLTAKPHPLSLFPSSPSLLSFLIWICHFTHFGVFPQASEIGVIRTIFISRAICPYTTYEHWYLIGGDFGYHTSSNNLVSSLMDVHMHRQAIAMPTQQQSLIKEETQILTCAESTKKRKLAHTTQHWEAISLVGTRTQDQSVSDCHPKPLDHVCDMLSSDPPRYINRCYIWRFCPQIRVGCDENKEANTIFDSRTRIYAKKYIIWHNLKCWIELSFFYDLPGFEPSTVQRPHFRTLV